MKSPYYLGGTANFGPPSDLAGILRQRSEALQQDGQAIGQFAGALGSGVVGGVQGGMNPSAFGGDTGAGMGALKGFAMNFNNSYNGGGSGGFARLVQGGGGAGAAGGGGVNFKQFEAMGKAADGVRDAMKAGTPSLPDEQPAVLGFTDDQWKHLGTADKVQALGAFQQSLNAKSQIQAYDLGQLHMQQAHDQIAQAQADKAAWTRFGVGANTMTQPVPLSDNPMVDANSPVQSPAVNMAAFAMAHPQPLNGQEMLSLAVKSGVSPTALSRVAQASLDTARASKLEPGAAATDNMPKKVDLGGTPVIYNPKGGNFQIDPSYGVTQRAQAAKELLNQRLSGLSADQRLQSLDRQLKFLTSADALVTIPDDAERTAKIEALQQARQELLDGQKKDQKSKNANDPLGLF